ncbi:hypothetical protein V1477_011310, partial [Vespula maculifrons]
QRLPTGVAQGATVNGQRGKYAAADPISNSTLGEIDGCVCAGETIAVIARATFGAVKLSLPRREPLPFHRCFSKEEKKKEEKCKRLEMVDVAVSFTTGNRVYSTNFREIFQEPGHAQTIVSTVRMVDRWEEVGRVDCAREGRLSRLDEYPQGRPWRENESSTCYGKAEYPRCESQTFLPRFGDNFVIAAMNFRGVDFRSLDSFHPRLKNFYRFAD